jgi:hypothetical protein
MTINTDYDVRSGAMASSRTPGLTFIDRWIPKKFWLYLGNPPLGAALRTQGRSVLCWHRCKPRRANETLRGSDTRRGTCR